MIHSKVQSVVSADITDALNKLDKETDRLVALDGATYHNIYLAWDKQYTCNGTAAARAAALNASKAHTYANKTNFSNATCSANRTRELNRSSSNSSADGAASTPALVHKAVPAVAKK